MFRSDGGVELEATDEVFDIDVEVDQDLETEWTKNYCRMDEIAS